MNKISSLWRVGVLAAAVLGGSGGAYAATVFQDDFSAPIVAGSCAYPNAADPNAQWRQDTMRFTSFATTSVGVTNGALAISSNDTGGGGVVSKTDSRFDFISPGQKRKFIVKGVNVAGAGDDVNSKMFRFLLAAEECGGITSPHFQMTVYANGQFAITVGKPSITGNMIENTLIDMNYSMPQAADQLELTLDNTDYELSFVFNVAAKSQRPAYQGAFSYRGKHGMDAATWNKYRNVGAPGAASIGLYATSLSLTYPVTDVTVDSITVTDGAP